MALTLPELAADQPVELGLAAHRDDRCTRVVNLTRKLPHANVHLLDQPAVYLPDSPSNRGLDIPAPG